MDLVIYGAGGMGREVAWLAESCRLGGEPVRVRCFVDDRPARWGAEVNGYGILGLEQARAAYPEALLSVALGDPRDRERLVRRAEAAGFTFATLVHPHVERSDRVLMGEGAVICVGSILTVDIRLGRHVQINTGCSIAHDTVLDDFATLAPAVHLAGRVHVGRGAYLGIGASVINGTEDEPLTIGRGAVIGAGAVVIRSVAAGVTAVGVPAKPLAARVDPAH